MKTEPSHPIDFPPPHSVRGRRIRLHGDDCAILVFTIPTGAAESALELTSAESDVVNLVLAGLSNEEVALRRRTSTRTVANQLQAIYRKLGIGSRIELATRLCGSEVSR